ncbi:MAG: LPS assembly lipoprotein LptE [Proteobacteria bacterium]|nr:LPS assembly lipoprotein LptE [Pseudomonadota bacterium]MDA0928835.1 LPS assembly lipoprotein LptE [Pseudomonadota bacterium]
MGSIYNGASTIRIALLLMLVLVLGSCGFALRGSDAVAANFRVLALNLEQPNSDLARLLESSLESAGVDTSPALGTSVPTLSLGSEQVISRPVTVNPRARAAQYEIRLSVPVSLVSGGDFLIPRQDLMVERRHFEDIANIAGNREEVEIITAEMRRDLVNQLMRRLQAAGS